MKREKSLRSLLLTLSLSLLTLTSCRIEPPLHLPENGEDVDIKLPEVRLQLDILWHYQLKIDTINGEVIDSTYDWRDEFYYGWDSEDNKMFGTWDIVTPTVFNIRRYYTDSIPGGKHTTVNEHQIEGNSLLARYRYGYYDILAWNEVATLDGVQSLHFDETTTLDYVTAYTNESTNRARNVIKHQYAYYQPEFLFGGYSTGVYISKNLADYDYYDEVNNTYVKDIDMELEPRTYIYLTQVILRNNKGRISGIDGTAALEGMASKTNVNTGVTDDDDVAVTYNQRMKSYITYKDETVDIIGGRLFTFGLCGQNPSRSSRATARSTSIRNYLDVTVTFNNGKDSTLVFDVTDQVQKRYKGGIITVELDMDTVKIPSSGPHSGFDAVVEDFDTITKEIDMAKPELLQTATKADRTARTNNSNNNTPGTNGTRRNRDSKPCKPHEAYKPKEATEPDKRHQVNG